MGGKNKISIDPGLNGTGYAIWSSEWRLISHGVLTSSEIDFQVKGYALVASLEELTQKWKCGSGCIEFPKLFQSAGGLAVANSGALVKLSWFVGLVCGQLSFPLELVEVNDWKGQLPKNVIERRIKRILPGCKAKSHDWDAIGIGLFKAGRF